MQTNSQGYAVIRGAPAIDRRALSHVQRTLREVEWLTFDELTALPGGDVFVFDAEVYRNFFFLAFKHVKSGKYVAYELSPACTQLDTFGIQKMFWTFLCVGFNINLYDLLIIAVALKGADNNTIKEASDDIIKYDMGRFDFEHKYKVKMPTWNTIDLMPVAPLDASLKTYMARMHAPRLQDLPIPESAILTAEDAAVVRPYCCNDLDGTELLWLELEDQIDLRVEMSHSSSDLRSKSDAQIAEAVMNAEIQKLTGSRPRKLESAPEFVAYLPPPLIGFRTPGPQEAFALVQSLPFYLDAGGKPVLPPQMTPAGTKKTDKKGWPVKIGSATYRVALGGLHSCETSVSYYADDEYELCDIDVASFYPRILLNSGLYPIQVGQAFTEIYRAIVDKRLTLKEAATLLESLGKIAEGKLSKKQSDSLKITINGLFGKLGNRFSTVYAPHLMLFVTLTGQFVLMMLIEALELVGIQVVSGNTDGIVVRIPRARKEEVNALVKEWEHWTGFQTETTNYASIHIRDVNNYIAVGMKGKIKTKGDFSEVGSAQNSRLSKNPEHYICSLAVQNLITKKWPIEKTIKECDDIRQFLCVYNVKGGGQKNGVYLGKVVRWYFAANEPGFISFVDSGNKVANTDGGKPIMDLPPSLPADIDYARYIKIAREMLYKLGIKQRAKTATLLPH